MQRCGPTPRCYGYTLAGLAHATGLTLGTLRDHGDRVRDPLFVARLIVRERGRSVASPACVARALAVLDAMLDGGRVKPSKRRLLTRGVLEREFDLDAETLARLRLALEPPRLTPWTLSRSCGVPLAQAKRMCRLAAAAREGQHSIGLGIELRSQAERRAALAAVAAYRKRQR